MIGWTVDGLCNIEEGQSYDLTAEDDPQPLQKRGTQGILDLLDSWISMDDELIVGWAVDGLSDVVVGQSHNLTEEADLTLPLQRRVIPALLDLLDSRISMDDELIVGWAVDGLCDVVVGQSHNLTEEADLSLPQQEG
jgi:hypothetical protein